MKSDHISYALHARAALLFSLLLLVGCIGSSPPSRFYLLGLPAKSQPATKTREYRTIVSIASVKLPSHLDRPQIVTRSGPHSLVVAEFDRWGEPLGESFTRVLTDNLSDLLAAEGVLVSSWRGSVAADYRLVIDARRFDLEADAAVLDATWVLLAESDDTPVVKHRTVAREVVQGDGDDFEAKVASLSSVLGVLGEHIAAGIKEALSQGGGGPTN